MAKQYSAEFKLEAIRQIERTGEPVARVAAELGMGGLSNIGKSRPCRFLAAVS